MSDELPSDEYTSEARLCDDAGMVSDALVTDCKATERPSTSYLDRLHHLRELTAWGRGENAPKRITEAFACTGHAHLAGEHIRCTSPAHEDHTPEVDAALRAGDPIWIDGERFTSDGAS